MERGEKSLLSDLGSELRLGREKEKKKWEDNILGEQTNKQKANRLRVARSVYQRVQGVVRGDRTEM